MGITIDKAMNNLNGILTEATEGENSVCYVTENDAETLQVAIDTMRKYQKIEKIIDDWNNQKINNIICCLDIKEVIEDGKID